MFSYKEQYENSENSQYLNFLFIRYCTLSTFPDVQTISQHSLYCSRRIHALLYLHIYRCTYRSPLCRACVDYYYCCCCARVSFFFSLILYSRETRIKIHTFMVTAVYLHTVGTPLLRRNRNRHQPCTPLDIYILYKYRVL